jgi:predicted RNA polymerase sigma factor
MVSLSRAIATAMVHGPEVGLEMLNRLDDDVRLQGSHRLDAVRGHLYERAGNRDRALAHYRAAAERTMSMPERNYLLTRAARLASEPR